MISLLLITAFFAFAFTADSIPVEKDTSVVIENTGEGK